MKRLLLLTVAVALLIPAAAQATTGGELIGFLNAQRTANGIPAGITENTTWSDGCAKHNHYGALNNELVHDEDNNKPGYTPEGDQAGSWSVLYRGSSWTAARNPFEEAPIHLHQLLWPRLDVMGAAESEGFGCATTFASLNRPAPPLPITYTYPGNGSTSWVTKQVAFEGPFTPGEKLGIPQGTATGPYLYVMFDGPALNSGSDADITAATLTDPAGAPVEILIVDNKEPAEVGIYLPPGGMLIPRNALASDTTYTAHVVATVATGGGPVAFDHTWSFKTGGQPNAVTITGSTVTGLDATLTIQSTAPGGSIAATGPGGATATATIEAGGVARLHLPAYGGWRACASTGGGDTGFTNASHCIDFTAPEPPPPPPPPPPVATLKLGTASARLRGGRVEVRITCSARCALRVGGTLTRRGKKAKRLKLRTASLPAAGTATLRFKLPSSLARALRKKSARRRARLRIAVTDTLGGKPLTVTVRVS